MRLVLWIASTALAAGGCAVVGIGSALADDAGGAGLSAADRRALIAEAGYEMDAEGRVENLCGERVDPRFVPAEIGGSVGMAELVVIPGGPSSADCYGDTPGDMYLMARRGSGFHVVFADGGRISILPSTGAGGVHDIALNRDGTYPVFRWDGDDYVWSGRDTSQREFSAGPSLP